MKARCTNPNHVYYTRYGGRGIKVCERWNSFENFYSDMGEAPPRRSIERVNNDKGYYKANCRWATPREQANNTKRNHNVSGLGKRQCVSAWARELNMNHRTILNRLLRGQSIEQMKNDPPIACRLLTAKGMTKNLAEWGRDLGVTGGAIYHHIKRGRSMEEVVDYYFSDSRFKRIRHKNVPNL